MEEREDNTIYKVVLNHEEQYSIWPADRENALGWNDAGKSGGAAHPGTIPPRAMDPSPLSGVDRASNPPRRRHDHGQ